MVKVNSLENKKCAVEFVVEMKVIQGREIKGRSRKPFFESLSKRGIEKAWREMEKRFDADTTMVEAVGILEDNGIKCKRGE